MTGAPREAYAPRDFIIVSMAAVKALGGSWEAAGCFQRIAWRAERDGYWRATMKEIADEISVSERTAKRITAKLREMGWVSAERENTWDSTLTWRVIFDDDPSGSAKLAPSEDEGETAGQDTEGHPDTSGSANLAPSGVPNEAPSQGDNLAPSQEAILALPSLETEETEETKDTPAVAGERRDLNEGRDDVDRLCEHLSDRLTERDVKHNPKIKAWRDAARLMIDADGRTEQQIHNMIEWSSQHHFWHPVIHSMPKLRVQYDQMREQALRDASSTANVRPITNRHITDTEGAHDNILSAFNG